MVYASDGPHTEFPAVLVMVKQAEVLTICSVLLGRMDGPQIGPGQIQPLGVSSSPARGTSRGSGANPRLGSFQTRGCWA